jgi:hypothetical protein
MTTLPWFTCLANVLSAPYALQHFGAIYGGNGERLLTPEMNAIGHTHACSLEVNMLDATTVKGS